MPIKDIEKRRLYTKNYYQEHKENFRLYGKGSKKRRAQKDKTLYKRENLLNKYGITLDDYNEMFDIQGGCCAICGKHQSELKSPPHVDHNHETRFIRGLLCAKCNMGIGHLDNNVELLRKALAYLEKEYE